MTTTAPLLGAELVDRFRRDGFVVVPEVFSPDELGSFGAAVDAAVAEDKRDDTRSLAERSRYEQSFLQCQNLWLSYPEVLPWTFHPRLGQVAAELLGVAAVRIWHDQALYKEPGGRPTDPHQDHPYWPIRETEQITAWIPFEGSTTQSGAMAYYPGSHKAGIDRFVNIFGDDDPEDIGQDPALEGIDPVLVEVPTGGVAFHHGMTAHFAQPNRSDRMRRVHTVIYLADGCHRGRKFSHPSVDFDQIEVGAPIEGSITPVVWPREPGDLPAVPQGAAEMMAELKRRWRAKR